MAAEQASERLGLGLAELRELGGDMRYRAVVLTDLGTARTGADRGGVAVKGQRIGESLRSLRLADRRDQRAIPRLELGHPTPGELLDGRLAAGLTQEAQGVHCKVVVCLVEGIASGVGDREHLGWATPATGAVDSLLTRLERAVSDEVVQVSTHGRRRQQ